jgi:hypothetical protein
MENETHIAYGRLMRELRALDGAKLHPAEVETLREAADARLFGDDDAIERCVAAEQLMADLADCERVTPELAEEILDLLGDVLEHGEAPVPA